MPSIYGLDFQTNQFFARSLARFAAQKARFTLLETREVDLYMWQVYDLCPGGVLAEKLGRGVRPASQNPYPIYDQNLRFSLPYL